MKNASQNLVGRMFHVALVLALTGVWWAAAESALAAPITVPNFSFEDSAMADGSFDAEPIPGWTFTGTFLNGGAYNSTNSEFSGSTGGPLPAPADANHFLLSNLTRSATPGNHAVSITSASSLGIVQAFTQYTLTVALGNRKSDNPDVLSIEFLVNDVVVPSSTVTVLGSTVPEDSFLDLSTTFTTAMFADPLVGGTLKVQIRHSTLAGSGVATGDFDNVRVDALTGTIPVPEPSAFCLLGFGTLALRQRTRRRR